MGSSAWRDPRASEWVLSTSTGATGAAGGNGAVGVYTAAGAQLLARPVRRLWDASREEPGNRDACAALAADLGQAVALVERGACSFSEKADHVRAANGSLALIANYDDDIIEMNMQGNDFPALMIGSALRDAIRASYAPNGAQVTVAFSAQPDLTSERDAVSPFSSTSAYVDVSAPGSDILSTLPTALGEYGVYSGT